VSDENIEILISNNCSSDDTADVSDQVEDPRVRYFETKSPLAMHGNYEFILSKALGEWVYILGDDDAVMPHVADYLRYITKKYPACEAVVTPRAYYFWQNARDVSGGFVVNASFNDKEVWRDSKQFLADLLDAKTNYLFGPQNYSGGFQRRSLIRRVINAQNGTYYKSVTPDAYSALMGCIHTYRFLVTGVPVTWVGTSDSKSKSTNPKSSTKNRELDFFGLHNEDDIIIHRALGDLRNYTLPLVFYEAYLSAFPTTSYRELNRGRLLVLLADARDRFIESDKEVEFTRFLDYLGVKLSELDPLIRKRKREEFIARNKERVHRYSRKFVNMFSRNSRTQSTAWSRSLQSNSYEEYPNILVANAWANSMFDEFMTLNTVSETYNESNR
jgi:glycosyltransferase involved in cell wall biosynthesis